MPNNRQKQNYLGVEGTTLVLKGRWVVETVGALKQEVQPLLGNKRPQGLSSLNTKELTDLDLAGSLVLKELIQKLWPKGDEQSMNLSSQVEEHFALLQKYAPAALPKAPSQPAYLRKLDALGRATCALKDLSLQMLCFLGEVCLSLFSLLRRPVFFRFKSFSNQIGIVGLNATPIVVLISFLIGIVLAYQGITQLARFGAQIYTVNLLGLGVLREIGVLLTSVVIAGRSGSAFTAEIGMMVVNEEVSALRVMGLNPLYILIIPRILALVVALPLLSFLSNIVALAGGALMMHWILSTSYTQFISQLLDSITSTAFWVGMVKAPFFGFIIGFVGCFEGMQVSGSAQSVGVHTTKSVVESIFLIIVLDALFSVLFAYVGI